MWASLNGHVEVVDKLLQHGARVDLQDEDRDTALSFACQENNLTVAAPLLKAGAYPNVCNKYGQTPLLLAVRKNNEALVKELVAARVEVNQLEQGGLSALMLCCEEGNSEMAELLLTSHADPDLKQTETGFTALMFIKNTEGMTASDVASASNFPEVCAQLEHGITQRNEDSERPNTSVVNPAVDEVIKRVHGQLDQDSSKTRAVKVPKGDLQRYMEIQEFGKGLARNIFNLLTKSRRPRHNL
jgi:ankyrin repeat protein